MYKDTVSLFYSTDIFLGLPLRPISLALRNVIKVIEAPPFQSRFSTNSAFVKDRNLIRLSKVNEY